MAHFCEYRVFDDFRPFIDPDKLRPFLYEDDGTLSLHFDISSIQSRMRLDDPYALELEYTRAMMGFLLWHPAPKSILAIGLGGGSLPKYCYRHLPSTDITVVEVNSHVIAMRDTFLVPVDDERFRVVCDDGARFVATTAQRYDVVLLDGFAYDGQPEQLCTEAFYEACRSVLTETGLLVVNLHNEESSCGILCDRIARVFGGEDSMLLVGADGGLNQIALASAALGAQAFAASFRQRWDRLEDVHKHTLRALPKALTDMTVEPNLPGTSSNRPAGQRAAWPVATDAKPLQT